MSPPPTLPFAEDLRLRHLFGLIRSAFGPALDERAITEWEQEVYEACALRFRMWKRAGWVVVLARLEEHPREIQEGWIRDITGLIQPNQLYNFPDHPLPEPRNGPVARVDETPPQAPQQQMFRLNPANRLAPAPRALELLNTEFPLMHTIEPVQSNSHNVLRQHTLALASGNHHPCTLASVDDVSYHLDVWPLLTKIHTAFCNFITARYPSEQHGALLSHQRAWDAEVRNFVKASWQRWNTEHDGLARKQAEVLLKQTLDHLERGTLWTFPPIGLFVMLPRFNERFAEETELNPAFFPSNHPAFGHSSSSAHPAHNHGIPDHSTQGVWTSGYLRNWLQQRHDSPTQHGGAHLHLHPHPNEHNMRELARRYRRLTERQAKRYDTTTTAFAAGL